MEHTRGGKRIGAGRKKGLATVKAEEARNYVVKRIAEELGPILDGQIALAKGMYYEEEDRDGLKQVYYKAPDSHVATFLINQLIGRPKETAEVKVEGAFSLRALFEMREEQKRDRIN
jgi:hypothetical protein